MITLLALDYGGVVAHFISDDDLQAMSELTSFDHQTFLDRYWRYRAEYDRDTYSLTEYWALVLKGAEDLIPEISALDLAGWSNFDDELISWAKEQNLPIALLSNMATPMFEALQTKAKWPAIFDYHIISGKLKVNKPERAIYEHLIKESNVHPSEILFLDDMKANVEGAQRLGIKALHYRSVGELKTILDTESLSLRVLFS